MAQYTGIVILFLFGHHAEGAGWSYEGANGVDAWASNYENCGKSSQSPINIPGASSLVYDQALSEFTLNGFADTTSVHTLSNNGHTVQLTPGGNVSVSGGKLGNTHRTVQLHFHWGRTADSGSEHTLNGNAYPMEVHFVSYNTKYPGIAKAIQESDGLAVLGFWFEISPIDNPNYTSLLSQFGQVKFKDNQANVTGINLRNLLPSELGSYYRYHGSLTTPLCYESVTWTLFNTKIPISERQMQQFRSLSEDQMPHEKNLVNNFRPLQPLNSRRVYTSSPVSGSSQVMSSVALTGLVVLIISHIRL